MRLLASVPVGRLVFTHRALPAILGGATADIICVSCEAVTGFRLAGPFAETEIARAGP